MQFLNQVMGLKVRAEDAAALALRTEGWVAGLQMAALSMQKDEDVHRFIAEFTGSQHYILDYLIEEVLQRQPEHVQSFLLQTSILDRMTGPLCDALLGTNNSHTVLETLEHANLFVVPLDDKQQWYRYHHLFGDLLRHRLHEVHPGQEPILHRRASEWHERNGQMAEAIEYALAAQDLERAASLIEQIAEATLMRSQIATFEAWIEALPDDLVRASRPLARIWLQRRRKGPRPRRSLIGSRLAQPQSSSPSRRPTSPRRKPPLTWPRPRSIRRRCTLPSRARSPRWMWTPARWWRLASLCWIWATWDACKQRRST